MIGTMLGQFRVLAKLEVARLLIRGRHLWNGRTEQSLRTALACFRE